MAEIGSVLVLCTLCHCYYCRPFADIWSGDSPDVRCNYRFPTVLRCQPVETAILNHNYGFSRISQRNLVAGTGKGEGVWWSYLMKMIFELLGKVLLTVLSQVLEIF